MAVEKVQLKTRKEFPVRLGEEFVVRDGDGVGVERWRHQWSNGHGDVHAYEVTDTGRGVKWP